MASKIFRRSFWYWDRKGDEDDRSRVGIVVAIGWMLSTQRNLMAYTRLYKSCGWDCLVFHPHVLNLFFTHWATDLALKALSELAEDLGRHPCPVVLAVFSGGHKACLYKMIQILLGKYPEVNVDECKLETIKKCLAGLIYDSSPMDFVSDIGAKFVSHQVLASERGRPIRALSYGTYALGKGLDAVFGKTFEQQRIELWHALYSFVRIGPILILCSEDDELAPVRTTHMFASNLRKLGGKVSLVVWKQSEHVGHLRHHPEEYSIELRKFLESASSTYSKRSRNSFKDAINVDFPYLSEFMIAEINQMSKLTHDMRNLLNTKSVTRDAFQLESKL